MFYFPGRQCSLYWMRNKRDAPDPPIVKTPALLHKAEDKRFFIFCRCRIFAGIRLKKNRAKLMPEWRNGTDTKLRV
jgi:hypothetical protein